MLRQPRFASGSSSLPASQGGDVGDLYRRAVAMSKEDRGSAIATLKQVLVLKPDHAYAHNDLGCLLYQQGDYQTALDEVRRALEIAPQNLDFRGNLRAIDEDLQRLAAQNLTTPVFPVDIARFLKRSSGNVSIVDESVWDGGALETFISLLPPFLFHLGTVEEAILLSARTSYHPHGQVVLTCPSYEDPSFFPFLHMGRFGAVFRLNWPRGTRRLQRLVSAIHSASNCRAHTLQLTRDEEGRYSPKEGLHREEIGAPERFLSEGEANRLGARYIALCPQGFCPPGEGQQPYVLPLDLWPKLAGFFQRRGLYSFSVGLLSDPFLFAPLLGVAEMRGALIETQVSMLQDAALVIGVPSWATLLAAMWRIPTVYLLSSGVTKEEFVKAVEQRLSLVPWSNVSVCETLSELSDVVAHHGARDPGPGSNATQRASVESAGRLISPPSPRVLIRLRANALVRPGGDTTVLRKLVDCVRNSGVYTALDLAEEEPATAFDLVHLINFATPNVVDYHAKRCVDQGVPYVVTTLYEDRPQFFSEMVLYGKWLEDYVSNGQRAEDWPPPWTSATVMKSPPLENTFAAENAQVLIASGEQEAGVLRRDYPNAPSIVIIPFGCDCDLPPTTAEVFEKKFGVRDFVLCVGRLERRKNQLMLLKALEHSDIPVVLVATKTGDEGDYRDACLNFKRPGKTVIVEALSPEELASAYTAARVHALPSWFELPGLVTVEAAHFGTPVVATRNGTIEDYLGDMVHYCEPHSPESVYSAVVDAYGKSKSEELQARARSFTWARHGALTRSLYEQLVQWR